MKHLFLRGSMGSVGSHGCTPGLEPFRGTWLRLPTMVCLGKGCSRPPGHQMDESGETRPPMGTYTHPFPAHTVR